MQRRSTAIAAIGALLLAAAAPASDAADIHHRPHRHQARGQSDGDAALRQEVEALKAQVQALQVRLDSQAQAQQQTAAQVQASAQQAQSAQAQAAQADVQGAQDRIDTIPGEVKTEVAREVPKPGWRANTKVGGLMFGDVSYIHNSSDGVAQPNTGTSYDIKRFYIILDHTFNDMFSANMTTDFTYDSGPAAATQLYIKKAYLQVKFSPALIVRLGAADLPWVPLVEDVYGYRYVENVMLARDGFGTTVDWGVHAFGSFGGGIFSYAVSAIDGSGYKKPAIGTANRVDNIDLEGRLSANVDHFIVAVGGYTGKLGHDVVGAPTFATAERADALIAYVNSRFRVGGEYFWAKNWNDVTQVNPALRNTSGGYSAFGSFNLTRKWAVFGRYDLVYPKDTATPAEHDRYFNVGVSFQPVEIVDLALVYKRDRVDDGLFSTSNGTIGGLRSGAYDEIGLFTRTRF
ncbi:MAG: porin [Caulobacteraceae bacterium]